MLHKAPISSLCTQLPMSVYGKCSKISNTFLNTLVIRHGINNNEPAHEISNNVVCATSKASDQPVHTRSLIRALASCLSIL